MGVRRTEKREPPPTVLEIGAGGGIHPVSVTSGEKSGLRYGWSNHRGQVTSAVLLLHRKRTMERAEPISTM